MAEREYATTKRCSFAAPRELVWALVADTNRWDRASGMTPGDYSFTTQDSRRLRRGRARELGFDIEWVEPPYQWVEAEFVEGERVFLKGPVARGGFRARLADDAKGTVVEATAYVVGEGAMAAAIGGVMRRRFSRALDRYLTSIAAVLRAADVEAEHTAQSTPAVYRVRRAVMDSQEKVIRGARTTPNEQNLTQRSQTLRDVGLAPAILDRLLEHLNRGSDEDVAQMRPFELARLWGLDRREVLRAFLHATLAGLVDLRWQLNCPVCRVSAGSATRLDEVGTGVHCEACNIDYDLDFGQHVEAVFQSNAAIRTVQSAVYCASSPSFLPHVFAQISVPPGDQVIEEASLPLGRVHLRTLGQRRTADLVVRHAGHGLKVVVTEDQLQVRASEPTDAERTGSITIDNQASTDAVLLVERSSWTAEAVLGSVVVSFPEFVDLFATEAPASGVELTVGTVSLLFSDLTGSTALYQRIGDAKAFAFVEAHFHICDEAVRNNGGAILKTMGDAVMASFASPADAVRAAIEMVRANSRAHCQVGLDMRVGVHAGPCLAVRANDRLDFFGTTVNTAARLEGQAAPGHLVLTKELAADPGVREAIAGLPVEPFEASLKGIRETQKLVLVAVRERPERRAKAEL